MLFEALSFITSEMNEYFRIRLKVSDDRVVLSGLVSPDGSVALKEENRLILTLVGMEKEVYIAPPAKTSIQTSRAISLNLDLLVSAYFGPRNYADALKFLSYAIGFFQSKGAFTRTTSPGMDAGIEKLSFEMRSLSLAETNSLWSFVGTKHAPFALYRVRMITIDERMVREYTPEIQAIDRPLAPAPPSPERFASA